MISFLKNFIVNLGAISIVAMMIFLMFYINQKLNQMNQLWLDANQVVISNKEKEIQINRAYNKQLDTFANYINSQDEENRKAWLKPYDQAMQKMLKTPPEGLNPQGAL